MTVMRVCLAKCCAWKDLFPLSLRRFHGSDVMSQAVLLQRVLDSECLTPTLVLYTSAICKVRKNWRLAIELFQEIAKSLLQANDFSYGATISACEKAVARWTRACLVYR